MARGAPSGRWSDCVPVRYCLVRPQLVAGRARGVGLVSGSGRGPGGLDDGCGVEYPSRPGPVAWQGDKSRDRSLPNRLCWYGPPADGFAICRATCAARGVPRGACVGSKVAGRGGRVKPGPGWEAGRGVWPVEKRPCDVGIDLPGGDGEGKSECRRWAGNG